MKYYIIVQVFKGSQFPSVLSPLFRSLRDAETRWANEEKKDKVLRKAGFEVPEIKRDILEVETDSPIV